MILQNFENLLKQTMGLDAASVGSIAIKQAVDRRLAACRVKNWEEYLALVGSSQSELQELIEAVIVPETWFLRDREAFAALAKWTASEWRGGRTKEVLRLLSAPCSTGEEPYSMAMTLLDAGVPPARFQVDAVDISARSLAYARNAIYGRNSFRGKDLAFRARHFILEASGHQLSVHVRQQVRFMPANLLDGEWCPAERRYDIIFCRNLLIYFDTSTQKQVLQRLERLLTDAGLFFVGPAEAALMVHHGYTSAKLPMAFVFRKTGNALPTAHPVVARKPKPLKPRIVPKAVVPPSIKPELKTETPVCNLETARQLADQGRSEEAIRICRALLQNNANSAPVFYLLGLIHDAAGRSAEASQCYRKTVYLDPSHYEALIHLAYGADHNGDKAKAAVLRNRAKRLKETIPA